MFLNLTQKISLLPWNWRSWVKYLFLVVAHSSFSVSLFFAPLTKLIFQLPTLPELINLVFHFVDRQIGCFRQTLPVRWRLSRLILAVLQPRPSATFPPVSCLVHLVLSSFPLDTIQVQLFELVCKWFNMSFQKKVRLLWVGSTLHLEYLSKTFSTLVRKKNSISILIFNWENCKSDF